MFNILGTMARRGGREPADLVVERFTRNVQQGIYAWTEQVKDIAVGDIDDASKESCALVKVL